MQQPEHTRASLATAFRRLAIGAVAAIAVTGSIFATTAANAASPTSAAAADTNSNAVSPSVDGLVPVISPALPRYPHLPPTLKVQVGTTVLFENTGSDPGGVSGNQGADGWHYLWTTDDGGSVSEMESFTHRFDKVGKVKVTLKIHDRRGTGVTFGYVEVTDGPPSGAPPLTLTPSEDQTVKVGDTITFRTEDSTTTTVTTTADVTQTWWIGTIGPALRGAGPFVQRFVGPGVYSVNVQKQAANGSLVSKQVKITVLNRDGSHTPKVQIKPAANLVATLGDTITFDGSASSDQDGGPLTFRWFEFEGDPYATTALPAGEQTYTHTFNTPGWRSVTLDVTDAQGHLGSAVTKVLVLPKQNAPVARISPDTNVKVTVGDTLTFDGSGSSDPDGQPLTYEWYSSDTTNGVQASKYTTTFNVEGRRSVTLIVTDPDGNMTERTVKVDVGPEGSANQPPVAKFTGPTKVTAGEEVSFDGSGSSDPDGDALTYEWRVRGASGVVSKDKVLKYKFPKAGSYGVELTVKDPSGASAKQWVGVEATSANRPPVAKFTVPSGIEAGKSVAFDGSASSDPDGDALKYEWRVRYAKGVVSNAKVLDYKFPKAGSYGVELTVTDPSGASAKMWSEVKVTSTNRPPTANFTVPSSITAGQSARFDGSSSKDPDGDALKYEWYVRGAKGVVSRGKVLDYKFPKAGSYGVQLVVIDPSGASAKKWVAVAVK